MSGVLLRTGRLRDYKALGAVGRPVSSAAPQLRAIVKRRLGADSANLLAIPQVNEAGDTISWYAPSGSMVVPWSTASEEERAPARAILAQARQDFAAHSQALQALSNGSEDAEVLGRMLPLALHIPDESHIHLVDGRPVLTFWGFDPLGAAQDHDVLRDLPLYPAAAAVPPSAAPAAPVMAPVAPARPWWRWLWWLLPLLLLLLLLLFGLRSCGVAVPVLPALDPTVPSLPSAPSVAPQPPEGGAVLVPVVPQINGALHGDAPALASETPKVEANGPASPSGAPPVDQANNTATPPTPQMPAEQPNSDGTLPPPTLDKPGTDGKPSAPPPQPLKLPPEAMSKGDSSFLNGHWRSRTGLMDSQTGRPLEVEYDIKDGKGTATIERSDGVKCSAPMSATIAGGQLSLDQTAVATCPDGQVFDASKVTCKQGKDGKADCQGLHADGSDYFVEIVK